MLIGNLRKLSNMIRSSFMTCNCEGDSRYNVKLEFKTLKEAQQFHRAMIYFRDKD